MLRTLAAITVLFLMYGTLLPQEFDKAFELSDDIKIIKLTDNTYVHITYSEVPDWGRVASDGMIYLNDGSAALFDTPMTEAHTREIAVWIEDSLDAEIALFVPNHWHSDCMGGYDYLKELEVKTYANELTVHITDSLGYDFKPETFKDSTSIYLGDKEIVLEYLGAAHTYDNIIAWIPSEKILFAGCMVKGISATSLGNTADGDVEEYPNTIKRVLEKYGDAEIVVPGHGMPGGAELLHHMVELAEKGN